MKKIIDLFNWSLEDIVKVIVGSVLFCLAINIFIVPNNLYTGGVLGIAQLIRSITQELFNIKSSFDYSGIIYYLINIPLFIMAFRNLGKSFFARTVFAVTLQAILLSVIPTYLLIENNILTNVLVGGILGGIGVGLTLNSGASTGGSDIIGLVLAKKNNNVSVGKLGLIINVIVYLVAGAMYGLEIMVYSIIYAVCDSLMIDKMHEQNICSTAFIFCKKNPKIVNDYIKNELNRDFTYWDAKGGFNDSKTYIIYTALTKYELIKLERYLKKFDDQMFMIKSIGVGIKGEFEKKF
jgi:uncharacterized membrane-anchored protein YitT (DUF2179 family)